MSSVESVNSEQGGVAEYNFEGLSDVQVSLEDTNQSFGTSKALLAKPLNERINRIDHGARSCYIIDNLLCLKTLSAERKEAAIDFWESRRVKNRGDFQKLLGLAFVSGAAAFFLASFQVQTLFFVATSATAAALATVGFYKKTQADKDLAQLKLWREFDPAKAYAEKRAEAFAKGLMFMYEHQELGLHQILSRNEREGLWNEYVQQLKNSPRHQDRVTLIDAKEPKSPLNPDIIRFSCVGEENQRQVGETQREYAKKVALEQGFWFVYKSRDCLSLHKTLNEDELERLYDMGISCLKNSPLLQDKLRLINEKDPNSPLNPKVMSFAGISGEKQEDVRKIQRECAREMAFEKGLLFIYDRRDTLPLLHNALSRSELEEIWVKHIKELRSSFCDQDKLALIDETNPSSLFNPKVMSFACVSLEKQGEVKEIQRELCRELVFRKGLMFVYDRRSNLTWHRMLSSEDLHKLYDRYFDDYMTYLGEAYSDQDKAVRFDAAGLNSPILNQGLIGWVHLSPADQSQMLEAQNLYRKILEARDSARQYFIDQIEKVRQAYAEPIRQLERERRRRLDLVEKRYESVQAELSRQNRERKEVGPPPHMSYYEYKKFCLKELEERNQIALETYEREKKEGVSSLDEEIRRLENGRQDYVINIQKDADARQLSVYFFPCLFALHQRVYNSYRCAQPTNYIQFNLSQVSLPTYSFSIPHLISSSPFSFSSPPVIPAAHALPMPPVPPSLNPSWTPPEPSAPPAASYFDNERVGETGVSWASSSSPNKMPERRAEQAIAEPSAPPLPN